MKSNVAKITVASSIINTLLIWFASGPMSIDAFAFVSRVPASTRSPILGPMCMTVVNMDNGQQEHKPSLEQSDAGIAKMSKKETAKLFPVIHRIAGAEWSGECRYVNADLVHASQLKLVGGVQYDTDEAQVTLSSFLTFPNGNIREMVMQGTKTASSPTVRLTSTAEEGGPIYMNLTELAPDTILINEVEAVSGKIIMTSSLSLVEGKNGLELTQVSHEVGDNSGNESSTTQAIDGHQVWRLTKTKIPIHNDDFDFRGTTGI
jgi:hypothetical protein